MHYLACSYHGARRFDDSVQLFEQVVAARKKVLGEDHSDTRHSLEWLEIARGSQRAGISWTQLDANVAPQNENCHTADNPGKADGEDDLEVQQNLVDEWMNDLDVSWSLSRFR